MKNRPLRRVSVSLAVVATVVATMVPNPGGADTLRPGTTILVSTHVNGAPADGGSPSISSDGRYLAFDSWDQLTPQDTDQDLDIYRKDMTTGQTILVSTNLNFAGANHMRPSISGDGNKVAYLSGACNLFIAPLPSCWGVYAYVKNISTSAIVRVSDPTGSALSVSLARDGSWATSYVENEGSVLLDVVETASGSTKWTFQICGECGSAETASLSANGRYVAFESMHGNAPGGTSGQWDAYWHDRDADSNGVFDEIGKTSTALVGIRPEGDSPVARNPVISDDGTKVAFFGANAGIGAQVAFVGANAGVLDWDWKLYLRDVPAGVTTLISQSSFGVPDVENFSVGLNLSMSSNGAFVGFASHSPALAIDLNPGLDVFVRDKGRELTHLVSLLPDGSQYIGDAYNPSVSSDGRFIAFQTALSGVTLDDTREGRHVYLRDTSTPCPVICPESTLADLVHGVA